MLKRLLYVFLSLILLTAIFTETAIMLYADEISVSGTCGSKLKWSLNKATGELRITGSGQMNNYNYNYSYGTTAPWKVYDQYISSVIVEEGVSSVGGNAFRGFSRLIDVTLPSSLKKINEYAFHNSNSITNVYISDLAAWCGVYMLHCFANPLFNENNLYLNGELVTDLLIPDSVTTVSDCSFAGCASLTSVTIHDSVTSVGKDAFAYCDNLKEVKVGSSVSCIGLNAFADCSALNKVTISDVAAWCNIGFEKKANPLYYAKNLYLNGELINDLVIPDTVTAIGDYTFNNCINITTVTIPSSVSYIGTDAFDGCVSLQKTNINSIEAWCNIVFENFYANPMNYSNNLYINEEEARDIVIPETITNINDHAFINCSSLTSVKIPKTVTKIGVESFYKCENLTAINIPNTVTAIGDYAFSHCSSLKALTIGKRVESIGSFAFSNCKVLTSISVPDSVKSLLNSVFYNCHALETVTLGSSLKVISASLFSNCTALKTVTFGSNVTAIGESAFYNCSSLEELVIPDSVTEIYRHAFERCSSLTSLTIPDTVNKIGEDAFIDCSKLTVRCSSGSTIHLYAVNCGINVEFIDISIPVITVNNYRISISNAEQIKDMRFAPGKYSTPSEIKNAPDNVAISNQLVIKNTKNGYFEYQMGSGGYYTIWIRMTDGKEFVLPMDATQFTPSVSSYGVSITLHDLYNVKDFYIAKGEYETYRQIKDNGYIFSATGIKIANKHDYTHTVYEPGIHTVLIRYNDGTEALFHEELTVDEPILTANGLKLTLTNIPDVKVIRTAYGTFNTTKELKSAPDARSFSAKSSIKNADEYTVQYRDEGTVTVIVEYNNGYIKIFHHEIMQKRPTFTQNGNTICFNDLDGLKVIRYTRGEYTSSAAIKNAVGSRSIKPDSAVNGIITVSDLTEGIYTFCVQYDDESYNYYTIRIEKSTDRVGGFLL